LVRRIAEFREGLRDHGIEAAGGQFPVQTLIKTGPRGVRRIRDELLREGVRALPRRTHDSTIPRISFVINATHSAGDIQRAVDALAGCLAPRRRGMAAISLAGD
jgi:7-keto-8-aminopelargonate synthetase-like enzyme